MTKDISWKEFPLNENIKIVVSDETYEFLVEALVNDPTMISDHLADTNELINRIGTYVTWYILSQIWNTNSKLSHSATAYNAMRDIFGITQL